MKKNNIMICLAVLVVLVLGFFSIKYYMSQGISEDAAKFKREYESLNGTIRESDGEKYNDIKVDKKNPIKYIDCKEALEVLKKNQAIVYVGAEWCPWCRNAVPVLFDVAKEYGVEEIYYLNLDNEKSSFEIKNGELVNTVKGSKDYYALLEALSNHLEDYSITSEDGTSYPTGEKRIFMPYIFGVKNGEVVYEHVGTVDLDDGQTKYDNLTREQEKELYDIYNEMFKKVYKNENNTCSDDVCY